MTSATLGNGQWSTVIDGALGSGALTSSEVELWGAGAIEFLCTYVNGTETNCTFYLETWDRVEQVWRIRYVGAALTDDAAVRYMIEPTDYKEDKARIRAVPNASGTGTVVVLAQVDATRIHGVA